MLMKAVFLVVRGKYSMIGNRISFSTTGHFGDGERTIEYSGTYLKGKLILDSLDHNTGRRTKGIEYVQLSTHPTR